MPIQISEDLFLLFSKYDVKYAVLLSHLTLAISFLIFHSNINHRTKKNFQLNDIYAFFG